MRELVEIGVDRYAVDRMIRSGELIRVRRDAVADGETWESATAEGRHELRARAVLRSLDPTGSTCYALSHQSALAMYGLPCFRVNDQVHLVRTDGKRGHVSKRVHGHPSLTEDCVGIVDGLRVVRPGRAALQVASYAGIESGLVAADAALHADLCTVAQIAAALTCGGFGSGVHHARKVAELADGRIESPGESRLRWLMRVIGYPDVQPQGRIVDENGIVVARVDFILRGARVVVEFDGRIKYTNAEILWAEKQRQDAIRSQGYEMVRVTWADLENPEWVRTMLRQAIDRSAARSI